MSLDTEGVQSAEGEPLRVKTALHLIQFSAAHSESYREDDYILGKMLVMQMLSKLDVTIIY